ncbi:hypothetical protein CMQ_8129 [Grosmannia clavigera kw1407]|uniref:Uncharacterized protein n=1 Tax=Grosmannia clavigera (strain kw1407 / UAMH 11150) TaxID=655863 RepID=F0XL34_GROCL|nr:uncharacterized protein CMQ_8129 [Grosmannia clavigera kw1407]EFX01663.1 hypothetical protein CMQ_8129 [Grosmannia clavigera kw1407]
MNIPVTTTTPLGQAMHIRAFGLRYTFDVTNSTLATHIPFPVCTSHQPCWFDDGTDIRLYFNTKKNLTAHIEDYYQPLVSTGSTTEDNVMAKYIAILAHLEKVTFPLCKNIIFWTWAFGEYTGTS